MENLTIKGNEINSNVLEEIKSVLSAPPERKVVVITIVACAVMIFSLIKSQQWVWIPLILLANGVYLYGKPISERRNLVDQKVKSMKRVYGRASCTFDVTFEDENIKRIDVKTRETVRIPYVDFVRFKKTKSFIAIVANKGRLIVLDRRKMDGETEKQALAMISEKCVNLKK